MTLLAAICAAGAVWLGVQTLAGNPLQLKRRHRTSRRRPTAQVWLSQAGAAVTPGQFAAVSSCIAATTFLVLVAVDRTLVVAAVPSLAAGAVPFGYWSAQRRKRANARAEAWPDGLRQVTGALRAGIATLHDALLELSVSGPDPLRPPMARYQRLADRIGTTAALEAVRAELADPISDSVILTFELASEEGTSVILQVLDGLLGQISGDLALAERVRTTQTQSRVAAWGSLAVPYLLLVFLCATTISYRQFYSSGWGLIIMVVGAGSSLAGFALVRRLARPIATFGRVFDTVGPRLGSPNGADR